LSSQAAECLESLKANTAESFLLIAVEKGYHHTLRWNLSAWYAIQVKLVIEGDDTVVYKSEECFTTTRQLDKEQERTLALLHEWRDREGRTVHENNVQLNGVLRDNRSHIPPMLVPVEDAVPIVYPNTGGPIPLAIRYSQPGSFAHVLHPMMPAATATTTITNTPWNIAPYTIAPLAVHRINNPLRDIEAACTVRLMDGSASLAKALAVSVRKQYVAATFIQVSDGGKSIMYRASQTKLTLRTSSNGIVPQE
jgi:hypothetical protein